MLQVSIIYIYSLNDRFNMKCIFNVLLVGALFFSACGFVLQMDGTDEPDIKILSWNIYMLPAKTFYRTGQAKRAPLIAAKIIQEDFDVVVFQEAFHIKGRKRLKKALKEKYPYMIGPANRGGVVKTSSGIWIVSKHPMREIDRWKYSECDGIDCCGKKGGLMVEVEKNGKRFQIVGTHLQAGGSEEAKSARMTQLREYYEKLVKPYEEEGVPQFLCGDFNLSKEKKHDLLLSTLDAEDGEVVSELKQTASAEDYGRSHQIIDYIFYRPNNVKASRIERQYHAYREPWVLRGEQRQDLSDHHSVEVDFWW